MPWTDLGLEEQVKISVMSHFNERWAGTGEPKVVEVVPGACVAPPMLREVILDEDREAGKDVIKIFLLKSQFDEPNVGEAIFQGKEYIEIRAVRKGEWPDVQD